MRGMRWWPLRMDPATGQGIVLAVAAPEVASSSWPGGYFSHTLASSWQRSSAHSTRGVSPLHPVCRPLLRYGATSGGNSARGLKVGPGRSGSMSLVGRPRVERETRQGVEGPPNVQEFRDGVDVGRELRVGMSHRGLSPPQGHPAPSQEHSERRFQCMHARVRPRSSRLVMPATCRSTTSTGTGSREATNRS